MLNLRPNNRYTPESANTPEEDADSGPVFSIQEGQADAAAASSSTNSCQDSVQPDASPEPTTDSSDNVASGQDVELSEVNSVGAELVLKPLSFGEELRNLRAEAGMTIHDVAHEAQTSQELIYNLEQGEFLKITKADFYCIACIERLCAVYKVAPDSLLQKFSDASRIAGRPSSSGNPLFTARASGSETIFLPEELSGGEIGNRNSRIPALVIGLLVLMLLGLVLGGWISQRIRLAERVGILQLVEEAIPELVLPKPVPLDTLPIPNG